MQYEMADWSALPTPQDDGAMDHVAGAALPSVPLTRTGGGTVDLSALTGTLVLYAYPKTGQPGTDMPDGWDMIPGARGCTPQTCAFRDHRADLVALGVDHLFGLSAQTTDYQAEVVERLHLPFPLLSDADGALRDAMRLPSFEAAGERLLKRFSLIARDGVVQKVFYPVFPPDQDATNVIAWLAENAAR